MEFRAVLPANHSIIHLIYIEQSTGNTDGVCMGIINFDTAGVFNFDCSVGYNAEAGMALTITVDAFDLNDLMIDMYSNQEVSIFNSWYAFLLLQILF